MQLFSADPKTFSKTFWINFLSIKTFKNWPQELLIIRQDPFISLSSPDHSPQLRIDFSYYEISWPDICSLICDQDVHLLLTLLLLLKYQFYMPWKIQPCNAGCKGLTLNINIGKIFVIEILEIWCFKKDHHFYIKLAIDV